jgi:hypothetical protein
MKEESTASLQTVNYNDKKIIDSILRAIHVLKLKSAHKQSIKEQATKTLPEGNRTEVRLHLHDTM